MELPSFDLLWQSSKKLIELESVLEEIDQHKVQKKFSSKKRPRRDGLFGVGFDIEDRSYYEPYQYCCDQAFYTEVAFNTHVSQHVKCDVEGCSFVSHPKSMRLHKEVVHDSGLFDKIYRETNDAAIIKWREARKRNYPTLERAAVKQEILSERLARGQVFKTQEFGTFNRRRVPVITAQDLLQSSKTHITSIPDENPTVVQTTEESLHTASPSPPIQLPLRESDALPSDCARLVSLDYDSDENSSVSEHSAESTDVSDNEACGPSSPKSPVQSPPNVPLQNTDLQPDNRETHPDNTDDHIVASSTEQQCQPQQGRRRRRRVRRKQHRTAKRHTQYSSDGEEHEIDDKAVTTDATARTWQSSKSFAEPPTGSSNPFASHPVVQLRAKRRACLTDPNRIHSRPTLLQMLLAEDMRTERNQLMQCVRYVVKNNFFQDEQGPQ